MKKFMELMERFVVPIAAKMGAQKHLVSIRDGFAVMMPLVIGASFMVLFNNLPIPGYGEFMTGIFGEGWIIFGNKIYESTLGMMSFIAVFTIAYNLAKQYDKDGMSCGLVSLSCLFMFYAPSLKDAAMPYTYTGATGLFVALAVALVMGTLFCKLSEAKFLVIKMPDGVPPAVAKAFAALLPSIIVLIFSSALVLTVNWAAGIPNIHAYIADLILEPMQNMFSESLGMIIALILVIHLLWFFGLHGSNIMNPIVSAVLLPLTLENIEALKNGVDPSKMPNIINSQFLDSFVNMGGSGTTICLIFAILLVSKNKASRGIAGLGLAPGLFNINEPVLFGMPIVLNPVYVVPFVTVPILCATSAYYAMQTGLIDKVTGNPGWTTPPILGAFLATGDWKAAVLATVNLIVGVLIYLPFVLVADKKAELDESNMSL